MAAAEKEIRVRNEREIEAGIAKVKSSTGRLVSQQMMENKRELFAKRGEVARRIAADVRGKLEDWVQTDAYHSWLQEQLAAALEQLPQGSQGVTVYWPRAGPNSISPRRCRAVRAPIRWRALS
mgnify:CR=1 FL=1